MFFAYHSAAMTFRPLEGSTKLDSEIDGVPAWLEAHQSASTVEVKSVFRQTVEGPSIELEYNRKPSKLGSTKYDLYLTIQAPSSTQSVSLRAPG